MILTCAGCRELFESNRASREYCSRACSNRSANAARSEARAAKPRTLVWSCGGGVDSTAIAALIVNGMLPKPEVAVMVDVGWEKDTTWQYADQVLIPRLKAVGVSLRIIKTTDFRSNWLFDENGYCAIPAYRKSGDGTIIKLNTHCSGPWKLRVVKKWLKAQGVDSVENWVGFAADEAHRAKESPELWFRLRFPLIELGMAREDCQYYLGEIGWPKPYRSSCVMCPQMSDREWIELSGNSKEFERACRIEDEMRAVDPSIFVHRLCQPLRTIQFDKDDRFPRFPCVCFAKPDRAGVA